MPQLPTTTPVPLDRRSAVVGVVLLVLLGCVFHLPTLNQPFGPLDKNAGKYFGLTVQAYHQLGFLQLRGMPIWLQPVETLEEVLPYFQHPPGLYWLMASLGTEEWALRLPTVISSILAAVALLFLMRPVTGPWPAFGASVCLLGVPVMTCHSQASSGTVITALGLLLLLSTVRVNQSEGRAAVRWRTLQVLVCIVGPWIEWAFGLYCLALAVLMFRRPGALLVPAVASLVSVGSVIAWRAWAMAAPFIRSDFPRLRFGDLLDSVLHGRPAVLEFLQATGSLTAMAVSLPVAVVGIVGLVVLFRRSAALTLSLLVPGATHVLVFATHAMTHVIHYCYMAAPLAAGVGALAVVRDARRRRVAFAVVTIVIGAAWITSYRTASGNQTTFFRDLGRTMLEATRGDDDESMIVLTNYAGSYPYYAYSRFAYVLPVVDPSWLEAVQARWRASPQGFRYLWFKVDRPMTTVFHSPELTAFLEDLPKQRLPDLERGLFEVEGIRVEAVYLVSVPAIR